MFTKEAADKTLAGRMYEYVLMAFGVFTIVHGLIIFKLFAILGKKLKLSVIELIDFNASELLDTFDAPDFHKTLEDIESFKLSGIFILCCC